MRGGDDTYSADDVRELSDAEIDERVQAFDDDERPIDGETTCVREWLAETTEPSWIAGRM